MGTKAATRRYTYGYGRAEDLAGLFVIAMITLSAIIAGIESMRRLINPVPIEHVGWVAAAGLVGFIGNELVAVYRIRVGRQIGSAALVADGLHARTDGFTSLAVVLGAGGVALGFPLADPIVGLLITVAILAVLRTAVRDVFRRLLDGVDPHSSTPPKPRWPPNPASPRCAASRCAGSATACTPTPNSTSTPPPASPTPTGSPTTPNTPSPTPCRNCRPALVHAYPAELPPATRATRHRRITLWRELKKLGVAQLADGVVALPADARTREQFEWLAEEVVESGGQAGVWLARPSTASQERELAAQIADARAAGVFQVKSAASAAEVLSASARAGALRRLRAQWRQIARRGFFPPPERDRARRPSMRSPQLPTRCRGTDAEEVSS